MDEGKFNEEFKQNLHRYEALKEQVANQIEMYAHLVETEGPNIESAYMMHIGRYECEMMRLEIEVMCWKRRFALRQMYLNRGEKPDMVAIEQQISKEHSEWREKLEAFVAKVKNGKLVWDAGKMSAEETNAIRCEYLKAVKKLHPDLNLGLPETAVSLWNQIQQAYSAKDWRKLKFLVSLVDEVVAGQKAFEATAEGLGKLRLACTTLEEKGREVSRQIAELKAEKPFAYEVLLEDADMLKERQDALKGKIAELEEVIKDYETRWENV